MHPKRAGTNLTGAAVEYDILIANTGGEPVTGIRLDARLLSASTQQDQVIGALFADTIERPVTAPFDLPAGETASMGGKAILPRDMVAPIRVGDKLLFVPVLTVNLRFRRGDGGDGQTARAFMIGVSRGEGGKLGPFPLDTSRMRSNVSALAYTLAVDR
ncbi:MAG: hypothetical protein ABIS14_05040 [Sphingomonas sp.]